MAITIAAALKRDRLLDSAMRAFRNRILPALAFARRFNNVPLEGTNKITVPYFPLATGASVDWNPANGYVMTHNQAVQNKDVTINKRKYRTMAFTSDEWNRQPYISIEPLVNLEAEKLADDVLADIWTIVTATNFPGTTLSALAATAFDVDDCITMRRLCNEANWPSRPRALILDNTFTEYLTRDSRVHNQNYGTPEAVREGIVARVAGFDIREVPLLPNNGAEKVAGAAVYESAAFVAFSPITPAPAVRAQLIDYKVVTDPETNLSLEYRAWGDPDMDVAKEVIECNYGFSVGEAAALKRIVTP